MRELLEVAVPAGGMSIDDVEFVALDIETTGLDAATADMLSVGWTVLEAGRIDLATAETHIVKPDGEVGDSATVHGLTDTVVEAGLPRSMVIDKVVSVMRGRVLLVHHAGLDKGLLDRLCLQQYGCPLLVPVVDTLAVENRRRQRQHHLESGSQLNLSALREHYNLPRYSAHDCLVDAIATAELLLAMRSRHSLKTLSELL